MSTLIGLEQCCSYPWTNHCEVGGKILWLASWITSSLSLWKGWRYDWQPFYKARNKQFPKSKDEERRCSYSNTWLILSPFWAFACASLSSRNALSSFLPKDEIPPLPQDCDKCHWFFFPSQLNGFNPLLNLNSFSIETRLILPYRTVFCILSIPLFLS